MCTLTFNKQSKSSYLCNSELLGYSKEKKISVLIYPLWVFIELKRIYIMQDTNIPVSEPLITEKVIKFAKEKGCYEF